MTDKLKLNANLVDALGSALRSGDHGLKTVPGLLRRVLAEESWRDFVTQRGEHVHHDRFADFVVAQPLRGIGASVELVRRVVADDIEAVDLLDQALKDGARPGARTDLVDNINEVAATPRGTSKAYALRRLRKDAPELHADVLAGRLSAHRAMIQAGLRPNRFTIHASSADSVVKTLRSKLPPEMLAEVVDKLSA